jgi:hypothetical protein
MGAVSEVVRVLEGRDGAVAVGADRLFVVGLVREGVGRSRVNCSKLPLESAWAVIDVGSELAQIGNWGLTERAVVSAVTFLLQRSDGGGVSFVVGVESGRASRGCAGGTWTLVSRV